MVLSTTTYSLYHIIATHKVGCKVSVRHSGCPSFTFGAEHRSPLSKTPGSADG
jgi:hypothetical protein